MKSGDGAAEDYFGAAVAISGNTAIVGAPRNDINGDADQGAAYIFVRSGRSWTQEDKLKAPTCNQTLTPGCLYFPATQYTFQTTTSQTTYTDNAGLQRTIEVAIRIPISIAHTPRTDQERLQLCQSIGINDPSACELFKHLNWDRPFDISAVIDVLESAVGWAGLSRRPGTPERLRESVAAKQQRRNREPGDRRMEPQMNTGDRRMNTNYIEATLTRSFSQVPGSDSALSSTDIVGPGLESIQLEKISP
ncbi:MAG: FG-GAP repeat protein [Blastocatellia bacterium]